MKQISTKMSASCDVLLWIDIVTGKNFKYNYKLCNVLALNCSDFIHIPLKIEQHFTLTTNICVLVVSTEIRYYKTVPSYNYMVGDFSLKMLNKSRYFLPILKPKVNYSVQKSRLFDYILGNLKPVCPRFLFPFLQK